MSITEIHKQSGNSFTQTAALPLTTFFTPQDDCTAASAYDKTYWAGDQYAYQLDWGVTKPTCYPSSYSAYQVAAKDYYSPGVCPISYEYVATSVQNQDGGNPDITLAVCCPPGVSTLYSDQWSCMQVLSTSNDFLSFGASQSGQGTTAFANPISVAWQESDLPLFTPANAPLIALKSAGVTLPTPTSSASAANSASTGASKHTKGSRAGADSSPSSSSSPKDSSNNNNAKVTSSGLSAGAAAGIGVGATLGVIAVVVGLWFFFRRYKVTKRRESWPDTGTAPPYSEEAKIDHNAQVQRPASNVGLNNGGPYEADSRARRAELEGETRVYEAGKGVRSPIGGSLHGTQ